MAGPARKYRRRQDATVNRGSIGTMKTVAEATKLGCRDAVKGRKNAHQDAAHGHTAAYRQGYRICDTIYHSGRALNRDDTHVMQKLHLESEVQFTPLGGVHRKRRRRR